VDVLPDSSEEAENGMNIGRTGGRGMGGRWSAIAVGVGDVVVGGGGGAVVVIVVVFIVDAGGAWRGRVDVLEFVGRRGGDGGGEGGR